MSPRVKRLKATLVALSLAGAAAGAMAVGFRHGRPLPPVPPCSWWATRSCRSSASPTASQGWPRSRRATPVDLDAYQCRRLITLGCRPGPSALEVMRDPIHNPLPPVMVMHGRPQREGRLPPQDRRDHAGGQGPRREDRGVAHLPQLDPRHRLPRQQRRGEGRSHPLARDEGGRLGCARAGQGRRVVQHRGRAAPHPRGRHPVRQVHQELHRHAGWRRYPGAAQARSCEVRPGHGHRYARPGAVEPARPTPPRPVPASPRSRQCALLDTRGRGP